MRESDLFIFIAETSSDAEKNQNLHHSGHRGTPGNTGGTLGRDGADGDPRPSRSKKRERLERGTLRRDWERLDD